MTTTQTAYQAQLHCFAGPMDLLLELVRAGEVDVQTIEIADLAGDYVRWLADRAEVELDEIGEFVVLASMLLEFKSVALLPAATVDSVPLPEEPPRTELVKQLLEYKRFREAASLLWRRAQDQGQRLPRRADDLAVGAPRADAVPIRELELWDLVSAFGRLLKENVVPVAHAIAKDPTPIRTYMDQFCALVRRTGGVRFEDLLGRRNHRPQLIGKFLALLELIKQQVVWLEFGASAEELVILPERPAAPTQADAILTDESPPPGLPSAMAPPDVGEPLASTASPEEESVPRGAWDDFKPLDQLLDELDHDR